MVLLFLLFAALWVLLSDLAVELVARDLVVGTELQTIKGLVFVTVTAVWLYFVLGRAFLKRGRALALAAEAREHALKILEEVASAYSRQFNRPLPISSMVRPEQYQHTLRRFNRYAVIIDTPPHSTGLAFDIDYRYMSAAEQNFVMNYLAQLKRDGRIEVLRERGANFHVFAFTDGVRPPDELIKASLVDVDPSLKDAENTDEKVSDTKTTPQKTKHQAALKSSARKNAKPRKRR